MYARLPRSAGRRLGFPVHVLVIPGFVEADGTRRHPRELRKEPPLGEDDRRFNAVL